MTAAAAQLGMLLQLTHSPPRPTLPLIKPGTNVSFGPLKHINAGLLNVAYAEAGPADGPPVILLHGWPYDIHSFVDVTPMLASAGYRVLVPYLRGYGATRFLSSETFRNGQPSALAVDVIDFMDALKIEKAVLAGFDWGARSADIVAALWPERVKALVAVSGYLIGSQEAGRMPLPPKAELEWWYQFYFATERGRLGYEKYRNDFKKLIWQIASPKWSFDDATFARSAAAFDNPDHVAIVIHNYRWRLGLAEGEAKYDELEKRLADGSDHQRARPSRSRAMPTAHRIRSRAPTPRSSRAAMSTGTSRAASGTTCLRRIRRPLSRRSSTSLGREPDTTTRKGFTWETAWLGWPACSTELQWTIPSGCRCSVGVPISAGQGCTNQPSSCQGAETAPAQTRAIAIQRGAIPV